MNKNVSLEKTAKCSFTLIEPLVVFAEIATTTNNCIVANFSNLSN